MEEDLAEKIKDERTKKFSEDYEIEPEVMEILKRNRIIGKEETKPIEHSEVKDILDERRQSWGLDNIVNNSDNSDTKIIYMKGHVKELKKVCIAMKRKIMYNKSLGYRIITTAGDFLRINLFGKDCTVDEIMGMEENHLSQINSIMIDFTSNLNKVYEKFVKDRNENCLTTGKKVSNNNNLENDLFKVQRDYKILKRKLSTMHPKDKLYFEINCTAEDLEREKDKLAQKLHLNQQHIQNYSVSDGNLRKFEKILSVCIFTSEELIGKTKWMLDYVRMTRPLYDPINKQTEAAKLLFKNVGHLENYTYDIQNITGNSIREMVGIEKNSKALLKSPKNSTALLSSILNDAGNAYDMKVRNTDMMVNDYLKNG